MSSINPNHANYNLWEGLEFDELDSSLEMLSSEGDITISSIAASSLVALSNSIDTTSIFSSNPKIKRRIQRSRAENQEKEAQLLEAVKREKSTDWVKIGPEIGLSRTEASILWFRLLEKEPELAILADPTHVWTEVDEQMYIQAVDKRKIKAYDLKSKEAKLIELVQQAGGTHWKQIAPKMQPKMTSGACAILWGKIIQKKPALAILGRPNHKWTPDEDAKILQDIKDGKSIDEIADDFGVSKEVCQARKHILAKKTGDAEGIVRKYHKWTPEDDAKLLKLGAELDNKWSIIAPQMGFEVTASQCSHRYSKIK